jgi:hypothetical protein
MIVTATTHLRGVTITGDNSGQVQNQACCHASVDFIAHAYSFRPKPTNSANSYAAGHDAL